MGYIQVISINPKQEEKMDYNQLESMYNGAKKVGAKGMLLIKWEPGKPGTEQYIPIMKTPLAAEADKLFVAQLNNRNNGVPKSQQIDRREFSITSTPSNFGLEVITYTKRSCIQG